MNVLAGEPLGRGDRRGWRDGGAIHHHAACCQLIAGAICSEQHGLHGCVVTHANQQHVHAFGRLGGRGTGDGAQQAWIMLGVAASGVNAEGNVGTPEVGGHGKAEGAEADHPHPQVTSGHGWRGVSSEFRCWTRHSAFSWIVWA